MHMRLVQVEVRGGLIDRLRELYAERIVPALEAVDGCRYAGLMQSVHHPEHCISLTLWDNQDKAGAYERGGLYRQLLEESKPYLSDASEYTIRLSEDLKLEYVNLQPEPVVKTYPVAVQDEIHDTETRKPAAMWIRIVSLKILPGKLDEFKRLHAEQVIPKLRNVPGCRYAYLLESEDRSHELIAVTSWDSREDAENSMRLGVFDEILELEKSTLSNLYQWKMNLGKAKGSLASTSEDVLVEDYTILTGKDFFPVGSKD